MPRGAALGLPHSKQADTLQKHVFSANQKLHVTFHVSQESRGALAAAGPLFLQLAAVKNIKQLLHFPHLRSKGLIPCVMLLTNDAVYFSRVPK